MPPGLGVCGLTRPPAACPLPDRCSPVPYNSSHQPRHLPTPEKTTRREAPPPDPTKHACLPPSCRSLPLCSQRTTAPPVPRTMSPGLRARLLRSTSLLPYFSSRSRGSFPPAPPLFKQNKLKETVPFSPRQSGLRSGSILTLPHPFLSRTPHVTWLLIPPAPPVCGVKVHSFAWIHVMRPTCVPAGGPFVTKEETNFIPLTSKPLQHIKHPLVISNWTF